MSEEKVNKRIISNVFWALVGKLAGLVSALLVGVFVACPFSLTAMTTSYI